MHTHTGPACPELGGQLPTVHYRQPHHHWQAWAWADPALHQGVPGAPYDMYKVGQNRVYTTYMTVYLVIFLPKTPHIHWIYMILANPRYVPRNVQPVLRFLCTLWRMPRNVQPVLRILCTLWYVTCAPCHMHRVGQNHIVIHIYNVHTVFLAGKSPYIWPYTMCMYTALANPSTLCILWRVSCDVYSVKCILWCVFCDLYSVMCILWCVFCDLYPVMCILSCVFCHVFSVMCIVSTLQCVYPIAFELKRHAKAWESCDLICASLASQLRALRDFITLCFWRCKSVQKQVQEEVR